MGSFNTSFIWREKTYFIALIKTGIGFFQEVLQEKQFQVLNLNSRNVSVRTKVLYVLKVEGSGYLKNTNRFPEWPIFFFF